MARIFISGSSEGLGLMAGQLLAHDGHQVTLHARNETRLKSARSGLPQAENVAVGDVSTIKGMRSVAEQANALGRFRRGDPQCWYWLSRSTPYRD